MHDLFKYQFSWLSDLPWHILRSGRTPPLQDSTLTEAQTPLGKLFVGLEGTPLVVPRIEDLSPKWKVAVNPHLTSIQVEYDDWVKGWFKDERTRQKIAALNADGFAAMAYPRTGREEVLNLSKLIAWYFPWDDAIDDAAVSQQPTDVIQYRDETIQLVRESLLSQRSRASKVHTNPAIQSFWDIGTCIRSRGNSDSNRRFADQQCLFVASSAQSQIDRKSDKPVTVEQYLRRREDNIAIHPLMELAHYAYQIQIPVKWRHENNKHMREMWKEIAWMGIMSNDLLSLKRELVHGQFESLVPLLMYHYKLQPQAAVDRGVTMIHESYERFYKEEQALYAEVDPEHLENMKECVQVFKDLVMCNLHWSYGLRRYMDSEMLQEDGSVVFDIEIASHKKL